MFRTAQGITKQYSRRIVNIHFETERLREPRNRKIGKGKKGIY